MVLIPLALACGGLTGANLPGEQFPLILGADVIYERPLVPLVANLLAKLLAPDGLGLIATPYRVAAEAFPIAVRATGLACEAEVVRSSQGSGRSIEGTLYRVTRRPASIIPDSIEASR